MLTTEQKKYVIDNHKSVPYTKMAKMFGVTHKQVWYFASTQGIKNGRGCHSVIYKTNEKYFDKWSNDMAYLLGFILADGCICIADNRYRLIVGLQEKDKEQVEWIRDQLSPDKPIGYNKSTKSYDIRIENQVLISKLIKLGIHPNKSYKDVVPSVPKKYKIHFLRGVFDGDGCIYVKARQKGKYISKDCKWQITGKLQKYLENLKSEVCIDAGTIRPCRDWHNWTITDHETIIKVCSKLYKDKDKSRYLQRKYDKYQELIRMYE